MGLAFWRKPEPLTKPFPEKLANRVSKIATPDLSSWIDQALSETSRSMSSYASSGDKLHLDEALIGAEAVNALVSELHARFMV